jgi:hypothetical protein
LKEVYEHGDVAAEYGLSEAGFLTGRSGGDLSRNGRSMMFTEKSGLERHSLQEVVADALAGASL